MYRIYISLSLNKHPVTRPLRYERVHLPLYKVVDAPFHIQGTVCRTEGRFLSLEIFTTLSRTYFWKVEVMSVKQEQDVQRSYDFFKLICS